MSLWREVNQMTYVAPQLTLIGNATGVVMGKVLFSVIPPDNPGGSPALYDSQSLLESEW